MITDDDRQSTRDAWFDFARVVRSFLRAPLIDHDGGDEDRREIDPPKRESLFFERQLEHIRPAMYALEFRQLSPMSPLPRFVVYRRDPTRMETIVTSWPCTHHVDHDGGDEDRCDDYEFPSEDS